jgi:hypothetical protein
VQYSGTLISQIKKGQLQEKGLEFAQGNKTKPTYVTSVQQEIQDASKLFAPAW